MDRQSEIARLRQRLERDHWPRLQMSLIVLLTGAVGFLVSYALLAAGVDAMALRYPLAAAGAYLAFLALLWTWARTREHDAWSEADPTEIGFDAGNGRPAAQTADAGDGDWDLSAADAGDEAAWVVAALAVALCAVLAALWVIWIAPALMAELILDVALAGGLYRRLRRIETSHWLSTALRRTALPFLIIAAIAAGAGAAGAAYAPGAQTFGDMLAVWHGAG
ncbi:hypothetical protein K4L06_18710 [Lysobacter sp. BMK333-48F3]|uniref:hypothetical protein n=1 Tax=Lysobacter sp. BMK333-48F3 TaxID=2867962 RepID=UPI001C8B7BEE|nr:hypothetical protein [Lysobacter sp. BMK333-48F3]MBX9403349.1 hypothetical protein [Lysobacter sp. BMK333-48F3]